MKGRRRSSSKAMLEFLRHALALTATVQGQLALLVRLQWIAGKRVAEVMTAAPFAAVLVLTQRIQWFDMGEHTNAGQHHHAWVVFDHAHPPGCRRPCCTPRKMARAPLPRVVNSSVNASLQVLVEGVSGLSY